MSLQPLAAGRIGVRPTLRHPTLHGSEIVWAALDCPGPVLVRVVTDYGKRPCRWISAAKGRFTKELSTEQKARFLARLGSRALDLHPDND